MSRKTRSPAVKTVRGPYVRLQPHPRSFTDRAQLPQLCAELRAEQSDALLVADLFAGAGGLSLGLEQARPRRRDRRCHVVFSVDNDSDAVETHRHHFAGLSVNWDLSDDDVVSEVADVLRSNSIDLVVGGPPCQPFSKAGRSGIRHQVRLGLREAHDRRRDLWQSYLAIIRQARPRAVVMENVPDMALDREMFILRTMVLELEQVGYAVQVQVIDSSRYGVPQFRQRLILVAIAEGLHFAWPDEVDRKVTVNNAISDLPPVQGGWRPEGGADGWADYVGEITEFQREMRSGVPIDEAARVYDHITRPVRSDDEAAFALMDPSTRYSELPEEYKRYRDDIFDDKYKRLEGDHLSRTVTAHIAKDGYWYIHPHQNRTITVREAARLQTFPDWFRFAGPPSSAFRQIGNAVPPRLGRAVGGAVIDAMSERTEATLRSEDLSTQLAMWFEMTARVMVPWLKAESRWQVISAERVLDRASADVVRSVWPMLVKWSTPQDSVDNAGSLAVIGQWLQREHRTSELLTLAARLVEGHVSDVNDELLEELVTERVLPTVQADMAALVVGVGDEDASEEPVIVNKGVLRVAARFFGEPVDRRNRLTDGRIAVARMVGFGSTARNAHLALIELANSLCRPVDPLCLECPLASTCAESRASDMAAGLLPGITID